MDNFIENLRERDFSQIANLLDTAIARYPERSVDLLALAYTLSQEMPDQTRYNLYQRRFFDFSIKDTDKVLDIGSGHLPFPLATHLADISIDNAYIGRAGAPFKYVDGKPVYECNIEHTPFEDKEFDFVYCSHVLEHVQNPEAACQELMRIGKRGYIECPSKGKDTFFATAKISNHLWSVECLNGELIFTEYTQEDISGIGTSILLDMNCNPQTIREKAIAGLELVKAPSLNTMLLWEDSFPFSVRRQKTWPTNCRGPKIDTDINIPMELMENSKASCLDRLHERFNALRCKLAHFILPKDF